MGRNSKAERTSKEKSNKEKSSKEKNNKANEKKKKSSNKNSVCTQGYCWRTISGASVNGHANTCENKQWYHIPAGCKIAPDDGTSHKIAKAYGWSTHVVVFSNGAAWGTKNYSSNKFGSNNWLKRHGNGYKVGGCTLAILLRKSNGAPGKNHVCRDGACWRTISDAPVNGHA